MADALANTNPNLSQLINHPLQAECLIYYLREERGESFDVEALVELYNARQITHDELRHKELSKLWKTFIVSKKIPLSSALEEEAQEKDSQVDTNPALYLDIFHRFELEVIPRLQPFYQKFLESSIWRSYLQATDSEHYRKVNRQAPEINNFPSLPFPSRSAPTSSSYTLFNALDLVRTMKANLANDGKRKKIDVRFCLQTKSYNLLCQGATELRKVSISNMTPIERTVFFLNVFHVLYIHGHLAYDNCPVDKDDFFQKLRYNISGFIFSLEDIRCGIFGAKGTKKLFGAGDPRAAFVPTFDPRIGLCLPPVNRGAACTHIFTEAQLEDDIKALTSKFLTNTVQISDNSITLPKIFKDLEKDLGGKEGIIGFITPFLNEELKGKISSKQKWKVSFANHLDYCPDLCWIEYDAEDVAKLPSKTRKGLFNFGTKDKSQSPSKKSKQDAPTASSSSSSSSEPPKVIAAATATLPPAEPEKIDLEAIEMKLKQKFPDVLRITLKQPIGQEVVKMIGPRDQSNGGEVHYGNHVSARVISTYPHVPTKPARDGDPICDRISIVGYENCCIVTMTDGCNWGVKARDAAIRANETFSQTIEECLPSIVDVDQLSSAFLRAVMKAHDNIMASKASEIGTTTLLGGVLIEINPESMPASVSSSFCNINEGEKRWGFFCISVGDCKAYHYSVRKDDVVDITKGNRKNLLDARDPGGRLGPYNDAGTPDLRNIALYCRIVEEGDLVIIVSDGVHDNFDPQLMGLSPHEMGLDAETWAQASADLVEDKKYQYSRVMMTKLLNRLRHNGKVSARAAANHLTAHADEVTKSSRDFMENFPKKKLPIDYKLYPGKMDHTSCICLRVGKLPVEIEEETPLASPREDITLSSSSRSFIKLTRGTNGSRPGSRIDSPNPELPTIQLLPELKG